MRIHTTLAAILLASLSLPALAGLRAPIDAYEVALAELQLPQAVTGIVTIAAGCATCESQRYRVTARTTYLANGRSYSLADYRRLLATVRNRDEKYLTVVHDRESGTVTSIRVKL